MLQFNGAQNCVAELDNLLLCPHLEEGIDKCEHEKRSTCRERFRRQYCRLILIIGIGHPVHNETGNHDETRPKNANHLQSQSQRVLRQH